jgi:D-alanyl-D-alanine carboxypeptidase (penicillin-binding protein 5/6)
MRYDEYNRGEMRVSRRRRENRYVTSSIIDDQRTSSIAIISAILLLTILTGVFFVAFADDFSFPAWDEIFSSSSAIPSIKDPNKNYPYATKTSKKQFVAKSGGTGLGGLALSSDYAILISVDDMTTVAYKNADEKIYPASMTKLMTVITALDYIENLDDVYTVTDRILKSIPYGASTAGMSYAKSEYGITTYTIRDIIYGISYCSGADSVACLMDYLNVSMDDFAVLMNEKAKEIGLKNTHFGGAIGMDTEENQTTCRDMAAIMAYAMENQYAKDFFSGIRHFYDLHENISYFHSTLSKTLDNLDKKPETLLKGYTLVAAKSGYEDKAGYCLVSYITNNETGERYVLVTANAERAEWPAAANPIYDMVAIFNAIKP